MIIRGPGQEVDVFVGTLECDVRLGDVHSLKDKRRLVRPVLAELRRRYEVSVAEVDHQDLHRRAVLGVAVCADGAQRVGEVLDGCERLVAARPELELLETRRTLRSTQD